MENRSDAEKIREALGVPKENEGELVDMIKGLGQPEPQIHTCDSTKYIAGIDSYDTIKTLKEWEESDLDLDDYLGEDPAEIDEDLADYIRDCSYANYCSEHFLQGGDPITTNERGDYMYITVSFNNVMKKIMYLGILPEFGHS